jgi:hypothetical protein
VCSAGAAPRHGLRQSSGGASMKLARLASASLLALTLWFMGEPPLAQQEQALIAGIGADELRLLAV